MPLKILRLGFTEFTLVFYYWLSINYKLVLPKNWLLDWLYTTSGYYDKTVKYKYKNVERKITDPENYVKYMNILLKIQLLYRYIFIKINR